MRWLLTIGVVAGLVAALYAGAIVAANVGVDVALFRWVPGLPPPQGLTACQKTEHFSRALAAYNEAKRAVSRSDLRAADDALNRGIADFGNFYEPSHYKEILDDTGLYLGAAQWNERRGKLKFAVLEKCRVLSSRLEMCGEVERGNKIYHLGPVLSRC
jgi:hypothetical protein